YLRPYCTLRHVYAVYQIPSSSSALHLFYLIFFLFNDPPTPEIYTLSLHDALPICAGDIVGQGALMATLDDRELRLNRLKWLSQRSEEHTSELQSRFDLVCRLLLEKKKKKSRLQ